MEAAAYGVPILSRRLGNCAGRAVCRHLIYEGVVTIPWVYCTFNT